MQRIVDIKELRKLYTVYPQRDPERLLIKVGFTCSYNKASKGWPLACPDELRQLQQIVKSYNIPNSSYKDIYLVRPTKLNINKFIYYVNFKDEYNNLYCLVNSRKDRW
jgi:hypothetical protein